VIFDLQQVNDRQTKNEMEKASAAKRQLRQVAHFIILIPWTWRKGTGE
jgi:hypothetical protein